jgi:hypothetical protein
MNRTTILNEIDNYLRDSAPEPEESTFKTALCNAVGIAQGEPQEANVWRRTIGDALDAARATAPSESARAAVLAFQETLAAIE